MMSLLVFVSAISVSLVLGRQERRHALELELECSRYGVEPPKRRQRVGRFEGWMNTVAGLLLTGAGAWIVSLILTSPDHAGTTGVVQLGSLLVAAGLALIIVGVRTIRRSRALR